MTKVLVIGNGAIGTVVGAELARLGLTPRYIGRPGPVRARATLEHPALPATGFPAPPEVLDFPAPTEEEIRTAAMAFFAVRAFDLEKALEITRRLGDGAAVIPLANGATWDLIRRARDERPTLNWRLGFATVGVSVVGDRHYAVRSTAGEVSFGPLTPGDAPLEVEKRITEGKGLFKWHAAIAQLAKRKWLYNTVINSLTAARRLPRNGDLLADLSTLSSVFAEALGLAESLWGPFPMGRDELYRGLLDLIAKTADNENSMARDVRLGRRTESAFLAGLAKDEHAFPLLAGLHRTISASD